MIGPVLFILAVFFMALLFLDLAIPDPDDFEDDI